MMNFIFQDWILELGWTVTKIMLVIGPLLLAVAYLTLAERRVIGFMQLRKGPKCGWTINPSQPFAGALKLMAKETILPAGPIKWSF